MLTSHGETPLEERAISCSCRHSFSCVSYTFNAVTLCLTLGCEKRFFAAVCGDRYKDGCEIHPSENVTLQADGTMRRLIIRSADTSDAGFYTCRAGNNCIEFSVNIRGTDAL